MCMSTELCDGPFAGACGNMHKGNGHLWVGALLRLLRISEDGSFVE